MQIHSHTCIEYIFTPLLVANTHILVAVNTINMIVVQTYTNYIYTYIELEQLDPIFEPKWSSSFPFLWPSVPLPSRSAPRTNRENSEIGKINKLATILLTNIATFAPYWDCSSAILLALIASSSSSAMISIRPRPVKKILYVVSRYALVHPAEATK